MAQTVISKVSIEGSAPFEVVGIGGVFVNRADRGRGLMRSIVKSLLEASRSAGPDRAMLFCLPRLAPVYGRMGFTDITDPVWAGAAHRADRDAAGDDVDGPAWRGRVAFRPGRPAGAAVLSSAL